MKPFYNFIFFLLFLVLGIWQASSQDKWDTIIGYDTVSAIRKQTRTFDAHGNVLNRLDEVTQYGFWYNSMNVATTYDANGNKLSETTEYWDGSIGWIKLSQILFTYDTKGNLIHRLDQTGIDNEWVNYRDFSFTIDSAGNTIEMLAKEWKISEWVNLQRLTYTYDSLHQILTRLNESRLNNSWENVGRMTNTYNPTGGILTQLMEHWSGADWVNYNLSTYTYDTAGNMLSYLNQFWQSGAWENSVRSAYTLDSLGNPVTILYQEWSDGKWLNKQRITNVYNEYSENIIKTVELAVDSVLVNSYRQRYYYDQRGNSEIGENEIWVTDKWKPGTSNSLIIYENNNPGDFISSVARYSATFRPSNLGIDDGAPSAYSFKVYPNPATNTVTISGTIEKSGSTILSVYSVQGQLLLQRKISQDKTQIDISSFSPGLYLFKLGKGKNSSVRQVIKE